MVFITIFISLGLIQVIYFYNKWSEIKEYIDLTSQVTNSLNVNKLKSYNLLVKFLGKIIKSFKKLLIIPIIVLLILNTLISLILSGIILLIF